MKHNPFKLLAAMAMGAVLLTAFQCGKEAPEPLNNNYNAHHSECLNHKGLYAPDSASVDYDAASMRLHVTHHNLTVNCGTAQMNGGIIVITGRDGNTIHIYETEDENNPLADCMCDVDNEFDLHGIAHGTYTLIFHSCYPDPLTFTCTL